LRPFDIDCGECRTGYADAMAEITPYRDGPLLVRGPFTLRDQDGNVIAVERETVALCRCGKSRIRPFCDGTHKIIRFTAPSGAEQRGA
jgi:CDGSH-type Zn-finger protein